MLAHTNPSLQPFPWLVPSEPAQSAAQPAGREAGQDRGVAQIRSGNTAALTVIFGGAAFVLLQVFAQPQSAADLADPKPAAVVTVASAPLDTRATYSTEPPAIPAPITPEKALPTVMVEATSLAAAPAPSIAAPPAVRPAIATDAAPVVVSTPSPAAETPVNAATTKEFWSVMEESREAARLVVSLANRQRPPRNATAQEQIDYRLRQQNAEAARGYRKYLDKLGRLMRSSPMQSAAQQLLERAKQTQVYLKTMLAESQASLR